MREVLKTIGLVGIAILFVALVVVAAMGNPFLAQTNTPSRNLAYQPTTSGDIQEVTLRFKNYEYELTPNTFKVGVPVRMTVDLTTVKGCMQDVTIPEFGIRKFVQEGDNIIEFTPTKTGTIGIQCSMAMGRGTFTVVE